MKKERETFFLVPLTYLPQHYWTEIPLSDEKQLPVFRKSPHLVIHDKFELVDMFSDFIQAREDCVVIGDGLFPLVLNPVRHFPGFYHGIYMPFDEGRMGSDGFDKLHVSDSQGISLVRREDFMHFVYVIDECALVFRGHRDYMVQSQVSEHAGFDLYLFSVSLPLDFVPGFQLLACHHACAFEHADAVFCQIAVIDKRHASLAVQTAASSLRLPFVAVAVAVEMDRLAHPDRSARTSGYIP